MLHVPPALVLLLVAATVRVLARFARVPYTLALFIAGSILAEFHLKALEGVALTPHLLLAVLLPPLLFEASFHLNLLRFRRDAVLVGILAVPALVVSVGVTAALLYAAAPSVGLSDVSFGNALLFAAMISATDPVSVLALFREAGIDRRLYSIVEGESLLNDGMAVVVFLIVGAAMGVSLPSSVANQSGGLALFAVATFAWMVGAGLGIGAIVGLAASAITRRIDDRLVEIVFTTIVAFGSFVMAEQLYASGVLACVAAGVVHGNVGGRHAMSAHTRVAVRDFWEIAAFFANTAIFLMLGLEIGGASLVANFIPVSAAFLTVLAGRGVSIALAAGTTRLLRLSAVPRRWWPVLVWGGLRGGVSMVLAMGLPETLPGRDTLLLLVFGVVGTSLLVQGLTMTRVLAGLGLSGSPRAAGYDAARLRVLAASRALTELDLLEGSGVAPKLTAAQIRASLIAERADGARIAASLTDPTARDAERRDVELLLLSVRINAVRLAAQDGLVADEAAHQVLAALAEERDALE